MLNRTTYRVVMLLVLLFPVAADAAQRTFVSAGSGSDSNLCTRQLPCRNFAAAISQTAAAGEVVVLDSGGYGVVVISQSVALVAPVGVHAAITAFSDNAITINAGTSDVVVVRGLYLSGLGAARGIDFQNGQALHVENLIVSGFTNQGLYGNADGADVYVIDSVGRQNSYGFYFDASTTIRASLDSVRAVENSAHGVVADDNSLVTVTRSVAAGNGGTGFNTVSASGVINVESCTTTMNSTGVRAFGGTARVRNSMITGNTNGVAIASGGTTISFGNNGLHGNTINGSFTTTVAQQ